MLAQEEARLLNHGFIGTEHILLGLIHEGEGVAAQALSGMGITLEDVRQRVEETIGLSGTAPTGSPPFTPRAKKVMELSLRESLQLGHNYIDSEHLLLGILREGEGVAAQALVSLGTTLVQVRQQVIQLLSEHGTPVPEAERDLQRQLIARSRDALQEQGARATGLVACSFCGRQPPASGRVIRGADAFICEHCIRQWAGTLEQPGVREARVASLVTDVVFDDVVTPGTPPEDVDAARAEIAAVFAGHLTASEDGHSVPMVENGENLGPTLVTAGERTRHYWENAVVEWAVDDVVFTDPEHAAVWFTISINDVPMLSRRRGDAVLVDGTWKMARSTFCVLMRGAGLECPPEVGQ